MSAAEFEIRIIDSSGTPVGLGPPPGVGSAATATPPGQSSDAAKPGKDEQSKVTPIEDALYLLSRALGFGQIHQAGELLIRAFNELTLATQLNKEVETTKTATPTSTQPSAPPQESSTASVPATSSITPTTTKASIEAPPVIGAEAEAPPMVGAIAGEASEAGAAAGAGAIAGLVTPIAIAAAGLGILGYAAKRAADALEDEAKNLSQYNEKLAQTTAQAELRQQLAEIERADKLGDALSEFQDAYSRVQTDSYKALTAILEMLAEIFTPILQAIEPQIKLMADILQIIADLLSAILKALTGHLIDAVNAANKIGKDIERLVDDALGDDADDLTKPDPWTTAWFNGGRFGSEQDHPGGKAGALGGILGGVIRRGGNAIAPGLGELAANAGGI